MTGALLRPTAALVLLLVGCAGQATGQGADSGDDQLTILAAASLTEVFQSLAEPFQALHPNTSLRFSFESSSTVVTQVQEGLQADVIATADEATMGELRSAGLLAQPPQMFALNELAVIVEAGNPRDVRGLADLADPDLKVVLAAEEVPAGAYAREALQAAGVNVQPVSREEDVKAVVSKVSLGEADAGIVYVTDVQAAGPSVGSVPIPSEHNVVARYPIAALQAAPNRSHAEDFVQLVLSEDGRDALREAGFGVP
jgi:molybdate transport system substrate-binding protein